MSENEHILVAKVEIRWNQFECEIIINKNSPVKKRIIINYALLAVHIIVILIERWHDTESVTVTGPTEEKNIWMREHDFC